MSRVEGMAADDVRIGMKVKARVAQEDATPILVFDPVRGGFGGRHLSTRIARDHGPCDLGIRRSARPPFAGARKWVVKGQSESKRMYLGGRGILQKKKKK